MIPAILPALSFAWEFRKVLAAGAVALTIWLAYSHYARIVEANATLRANEAKLSTALAVEKAHAGAAKKVVEEWKAAEAERERILADMARNQKQAMTELDKLREIFAKQRLEELAKSKPELLGRMATAGHARINRMFKCSSGGSGCGE